MKKILFTIFLGAFGAMVLAVPALAATGVLLTPANVSVRQGQAFTLTIGIDPQGVKNYTAKTELRYPADLLEVKSFTLADGWMLFSKPGYDLTDNTNGVLIKTAGYPDGVSSSTTFGKVSFLAKKSGSGAIVLSNASTSSFVLDLNSQNVLSGTSVQTAVVISPPVMPKTTPKTPITPTATVAKPDKETTTTLEGDMLLSPESETASQPTTPQSLLASIGSIVALGTNSTIVGILVIVAILVLAGYIIYAVTRKTRRKNSGDLK